MEAMQVPPEIVDALHSIKWMATTYPSDLPPMLFADLALGFDRGADPRWVGVTGQDWTVVRLVDPELHESLPVTSSTELHPGVRIEFACREKASITVRPLLDDDSELLTEMSVGEALTADITAKCLCRNGQLASHDSEDTVLEGSILLGRVADRYTFEYEPIRRVVRNFRYVQLLDNPLTLNIFQFAEAVSGQDGITTKAANESLGQLSEPHGYHLRVAAVVRVNIQREGRAGLGSAHGTSQRFDSETWRLTWSPPAGLRIAVGDLCVAYAAGNDFAAHAGGLVSQHAEVTIDRSTGRQNSSLGNGPVLQWMVALVFPNAGSERCPRHSVSEEEAMETFKRVFKVVVAGQNRVDYLKERWQRFREDFRELPEIGGNPSSNIFDLRTMSYRRLLAWRRSSISDGCKPYGCPGTENWANSTFYRCDGRRPARCEKRQAPKCFLELLQRAVIHELIDSCGLSVKVCCSEDRDNFILLVSCGRGLLLQEADRLKFHMELDLQAMDPESLEPCTADFEPLLHVLSRQISDPADARTELFLGHYQRVLETIEREWAEAPEAFRARFRRTRAFWLLGGMHELNTEWDDWNSKTQADALLSSGQLSTAFAEYLSLRAERGLAPHAKGLMQEACLRVQTRRCCLLRRLLQRLRFWSPLVEGWSRILWNHWDWFAGGMKHGQAMAFCRKRPGMEWSSFRVFKAEACSHERASIDVPFCSKDRLRLLLSIMERGVCLDELLHEGQLLDCIALDSPDKNASLGMTWKVPDSTWAQKLLWFVRGMLEPPLTDAINCYYSSRIAFCFELTKYLAVQLTPLGLLGLALQVLRWIRSSLGLASYGLADVVFSVVMPVWSVILLRLWRQREAWLVAHWGRSAGAVHASRPAFWGLHRRSPTAVGQLEITFPVIYREGILGRLPRQVISYFILLALFAVEFSCCLGVTMIRRAVRSRIVGLGLPALMTVFGDLGYRCARRLNEWENYPTRSKFIGNLARKISIFEFFNRYAILFYIAFAKASWEGCLVNDQEFVDTCGFSLQCRMCTEELEEYVFLVLLSSIGMSAGQVLTMQVLRNMAWAALTRGRPQAEPAAGPDIAGEDQHLAQALRESMACETYGDAEVDGSFDDYLQVLVLFGYAAMFSVACPPAPLICAFALLLELRLDGVKIFNQLRRPFPIPANGLESWLQIFQGLLGCAAVANSAISVWSYNLLGGESIIGMWVRFLTLLVGTCALTALVQLIPGLQLDDGLLPLQKRINCLTDTLLEPCSSCQQSRTSFASSPESEAAKSDRNDGKVDQGDIFIMVEGELVSMPSDFAGGLGGRPTAAPSRRELPRPGLLACLRGAAGCLPPLAGSQTAAPPRRGRGTAGPAA